MPMPDNPKNENEQPIRVLIVDDESIIRELLARILQFSGMRTNSAINGREALFLLLREPFDVVLVDLKMREMDGFGFIVEAQKIRPWLGIISISGYNDQAAMARAKELGIRFVLSKPVSSNDMIKAVREESLLRQNTQDREISIYLERIQAESDFLRQLTQSALESPNQRDDWKRICMHLGATLPSDCVGILIAHEDTPLLHYYLRNPVPEETIRAMEAEIRRHYRAIRGRDLPSKIDIEYDGCHLLDAEGSAPGSMCSIPILNGDIMLGSLTMASLKEDAYSKPDIVFLYHAANQLANMAAMFRRIQKIAVNDILTGLFNRGHFMEQLEYVRQISARHGIGIAVGMLDLDRFKLVNDEYGHAAGDRVLSELAGLIRTSLRASDLAGRIGGDEFALILPGLNRADALAFGERLLKHIRKHAFLPESLNLRLQATLGLTTAEARELPGLSPAELLRRADACLYAAKEAGKDRVGIGNPDGGVDLSDRAPAPQLPLDPRHSANGTITSVSKRPVIEFLSSLTALRMDTIGTHSRNTQTYALILADELGLPAAERQDISDSAMLHDIGKFAIPDSILLKEGRLDEDEWRVIRQHPETGFQMLCPFPDLGGIAEIVRTHHERFDGSGYPRGLKGEDIAFGGRIIAIADAYDALRSSRSYRETMTPADSARRIADASGRHFDPRLIEVFLKCQSKLENAQKLSERVAEKTVNSEQ